MWTEQTFYVHLEAAAADDVCVRFNDQWYAAPCISDSWGKFQFMFPLGGGSPCSTRDHQVPDQIFRIHINRSKYLSYLPPKGVL
jgi:hypothetical protein